MPTVVIGYGHFTTYDLEIETLKPLAAEVLQYNDMFSPECMAALKTADALMVTVQTVSAETMDAMPYCRIISRVGTGLDAIDIPAATERGIQVTNVPDYSIDEVSTHAMAFLLAHARELPGMIGTTRAGRWGRDQIGAIKRLTGQRLGILGFGRIGRTTAAKALGFGLEVVACDPFVDEAGMKAVGVKKVDWNTLLETSDYVCLHTALTDGTRKIVNAEALARMKPNAFLINTARGGLIDEDALLDAVRSGKIAGAGLDVLTTEPAAADHPFLKEDRIWVTPHLACYSQEADVDVRVRGAEEVLRVLSGQAPRCPVNQPKARS
ncbi:MAG: C-terminal binding protein [Anaerolineae bacterium]